MLSENQHLLIKSFEETTTKKDKNMEEVVSAVEKVH